MDKILEYFIEEPEKEFYTRELAKLTKKSPTTISKYLNKLKKGKILNSKKKFNHLLFKANIENPIFKDLKLAYNISKIRRSGLIDYLIEKYNNPEAIILFGSFAKAENFSESDVDLLIITPLKKNVDLKSFEKKIGHKIQLFLHSNKEINQMKKTEKELLNNLVNGIILEGFWELFK